MLRANQAEISGDTVLIRVSFCRVLLVLAVALGCWLFDSEQARAQAWQDGDGPANGGPPVYQQHAFDGHRRDDRRDRREFRRDTRFASPQVSAGWFQRPYPYHLDYYKMRYGGSYAPYFGNLYGTPFGTPQVVNYPPYYGPYYGGNGGGFANGYGQPGDGGGPPQYPPNAGAMRPGADVVEESGTGQSPPSGSPAKTGGEALPAPTP
jgi:hypothetical protein